MNVFTSKYPQLFTQISYSKVHITNAKGELRTMYMFYIDFCEIFNRRHENNLKYFPL